MDVRARTASQVKTWWSVEDFNYMVNALNNCYDLFGISLIDTGNLLHSAIVLGEFWEAIGGKISNSMDYKVGTTDGQSEGLQVLGIGKPWPVYLEGMEEYYILEPLVIRGLSHSMNL